MPGQGGINAPPAASGLFVSVFHNQQHFAYLDATPGNEGAIQDAWWDGDHKQWKLQQINMPGQEGIDAPPAAGGLFVSAFHNQQHFAYLDGKVLLIVSPVIAEVCNLLRSAIFFEIARRCADGHLAGCKTARDHRRVLEVSNTYRQVPSFFDEVD
jgi:hypothetical protein